jgi:hypothetical protein
MLIENEKITGVQDFLGNLAGELFQERGMLRRVANRLFEQPYDRALIRPGYELLV